MLQFQTKPELFSNDLSDHFLFSYFLGFRVELSSPGDDRTLLQYGHK